MTRPPATVAARPKAENARRDRDSQVAATVPVTETGAYPNLRALLDDLARRGVTFELNKDGGVKVTGWTKLTGLERARLRSERDAVAEVLRADVEELAPEPEPAPEPELEPPPPRRPYPLSFRSPLAWWELYGQFIDSDDKTPAEVLASRLAFAERFDL